MSWRTNNPAAVFGQAGCGADAISALAPSGGAIVFMLPLAVRSHAATVRRPPLRQAGPAFNSPHCHFVSPGPKAELPRAADARRAVPQRRTVYIVMDYYEIYGREGHAVCSCREIPHGRPWRAIFPEGPPRGNKFL